MTTEHIPEDRDLAGRVLAGEPEALAAFHGRYLPVVRGVLVRMVGPADADDLTQEVFLRAIAHLGRFRHDASLSWWMSRIAAHCGIRHLRGVRTTVDPLSVANAVRKLNR
jgi:DNA-directed RNA polymerase specialized sigma24 family protein